MEVVDILTVDGVGISVWANEIPPSNLPSDTWLDIAHPGPISPQIAVKFARKILGPFEVRSAG